MDIILLIFTVLGGLSGIAYITSKLRKRYKFDLDYKNITFAFFSTSKNSKINERFCLIVYGLRIINNSDKSNTLKNFILSYRLNGKVYKSESHVVQTGIIQKTGKPALMLSNGIDKIILVGWNNIRTKLGEYGTLQPGGVFSGSALFLLEPHVKNIHHIEDLKLIVTNFNGYRTSYPITIKEEWYENLNKRLSVINKVFTVTEEGIII